MWSFATWLKQLEKTMFLGSRPAKCRLSRNRPAVQLQVEQLETRVAPAVIATVTTTNDVNGVAPYRTPYDQNGSPEISLRSAIEYANANNLAGTINFVSGLTGTSDLWIGGVGTPINITDTNPNGLTIDGSGASITVNGGFNGGAGVGVQVFSVANGATATINDLTMENGNGNNVATNPNTAGGVYNDGTLKLTNDTLTGNVGEYGGAINNGGTLTLTDDTFTNNTATSCGGALYNYSGGSATLTNDTFTTNSAVLSGGAVYNHSLGNLTLNNDTITANSANSGGGIWSAGSVAGIYDTILDGNTAPAGADLFHRSSGPFISDGYNLYGSTFNFTWSATDIPDANENPELAPLHSNGGPTPTIGLLPGSPAIDAGSTTGVTETTDQRGLPRTDNGAIDIGAYQTQTLTVTNTSGNVATAGSLPYELSVAHTGDRIVFTPGLTGTIALAATLTLPSVTIDGSGAGISVSGGNAVQVFNVQAGTTAALNDLTIENGNVNGDGAGTLVLTNGSLTVANCTFSGNKAADDGGGIFNNGTLSVTNSTFSNDIATDGGGIGNGRSTTVSNCTLFGNTAATGGGISNASGTLTIYDTIVAGNNGTDDVYNNGGTVTDDGYNLYGTSNGGIFSTANHDIQSNNPGLRPLASNGGPTPTIALLPGSPALEAGNPAGVTDTTDQRGGARVVGGKIDIGAWENQLLGNAPAYVPAVQNTNAFIGLGSFSDSAVTSAGPYSVEVNWGDTSSTNYTVPAPGGLGAPQHDYTTAGAKTVTVTVTDGDGDFASETITVPVLSTSGPPPVFVVNTANDTNWDQALYPDTPQDSQGNISLRSAIEWANVYGEANADPLALQFSSTLKNDTITLNPAYGTLTLGNTYGMTIDGTTNNITISGGNAVRVFRVLSGVAATISDLRIVDGKAAWGAAVRVSGGFMVLANDTIANNQVTATSDTAGAIYNSSVGNLTLIDDTVSGNTSTYANGGIDNSGTAFLEGDTINGNSATKWNGGFGNYGTATLINVTVANNSASESAGGIYNGGTLTLVSDTIADNTVGLFGGGLVNDATATTYDTILADNTAPAAGDVQNSATFTSNGYNLYGKSIGVAWAPTDIQTKTPDLGALANNGGPTETIALLPGSPAINAGTSAGAPYTDQRGYFRNDADAVGNPDIGAFENQGGLFSFTAPVFNALGYGSGSPILLPLGSFSESQPAAGQPAVSGPYTIDISWGDNSPDTVFTETSAGNITLPAGHDYAVAGSYNVTITVTDAEGNSDSEAPLGVTVGAPAVPTSINKVNGPGLAAQVTQTFTGPDMEVQILDQYGNAMPGVPVVFSAPTSGASGVFANGSDIVLLTTNANGDATAPAFIADTTAGAYTVEALASGSASPYFFNMTNNPGLATQLVVIASSNNQTGLVGKAYSAPLIVQVTDQYGNPIPDVSVQFTAPASGPSAAVAAAATTGSNGEVSANLTANIFAGPFTVSATVAGMTAPVKFALTNESPLGSSPNDTYVENLYALLLNRVADLAGGQSWVNLLNSGISASTVVQDIDHSTEFFQDVVKGLYQHFLGRPADPSGLAAWTAVLTNGGTIEQVSLGLIASPEFFNDHPTNLGFVTALYEDVLGRQPQQISPTELQGWVSNLTSGATRSQVAEDFLTSTEYRTDLIGSFYEQYLGRAADSGGLNYFLGQLNAGISDLTVLAAILGSPEAYGKWSV